MPRLARGGALRAGAPRGRPDEDLRGGFEHGGWALPYNDSVMLEVMARGMARSGPLLLGRRADLRGPGLLLVRLKQQHDKDLVMPGSGELVQSLIRRNLIDEYVLLIHPLVLGSGRRLSPDGGSLPLSGSSTP